MFLLLLLLLLFLVGLVVSCGAASMPLSTGTRRALFHPGERPRQMPLIQVHLCICAHVQVDTVMLGAGVALPLYSLLSSFGWRCGLCCIAAGVHVHVVVNTSLDGCIIVRVIKTPPTLLLAVVLALIADLLVAMLIWVACCTAEGEAANVWVVTSSPRP